MPRTAAAKKVSVPGESAHSLTVQAQDPSAFVSNPDAAVDLGRAGMARRIEKPHAPVAPAVLTVADETRPDSAAINATPSMSVEDAKALDRKAKLQRSVMTPDGWYCPQNSLTAQRERKRNGAEPIVDID